MMTEPRIVIHTDGSGRVDVEDGTLEEVIAKVPMSPLPVPMTRHDVKFMVCLAPGGYTITIPFPLRFLDD